MKPEFSTSITDVNKTKQELMNKVSVDGQRTWVGVIGEKISDRVKETAQKQSWSLTDFHNIKCVEVIVTDAD